MNFTRCIQTCSAFSEIHHFSAATLSLAKHNIHKYKEQYNKQNIRQNGYNEWDLLYNSFVFNFSPILKFLNHHFIKIIIRLDVQHIFSGLHFFVRSAIFFHYYCCSIIFQFNLFYIIGIQLSDKFRISHLRRIDQLVITTAKQYNDSDRLPNTEKYFSITSSERPPFTYL